MLKHIHHLLKKKLDETEYEQLLSVLQQLYPSREIEHVSRSYKCYGHICLGGSIIGSILPGGHSKTSSVIMVEWAGSGNCIAENISMRVGIVEYFIIHSTKIKNHSESWQMENVFAYVNWKEKHPEHNFYGVTSTVSSTLFEFPAACSFLPVQRIANTTAHAIITVDFGSIKEPVFVTIIILQYQSLTIYNKLFIIFS